MVCGSAIGGLQIAGALYDLNDPWSAGARLLGTIALLGALFRLWRASHSLCAALMTGFLSALSYFGVALHWLGKSANPDPTTFLVREAVTTFGALWLFIPWWMLWFIGARAIASAQSSRLHAFCAFVGSFSLCNLLLGDLVMGIPMAPLSLVALETNASGLFRLIGQFGADTVLVALGAGLALTATRRSSLLAATPWSLIAVFFALPAGPGETAPAIPDAEVAKVYVAQPALPHPSQIAPELVTSISRVEVERQIIAGTKAGARLIVLPESALFADLSTDEGTVDELRSLLPTGTSLIVGFPRIEVDTSEGIVARPYNSAAMLDENGIVFIYDKSHLVPFGETMPRLFFRLGFDVLAGPSGGFGRGNGIGSYSAVGTRFALMICYEIMVSGAVAREVSEADWLLNISSETLFRGTIGPEVIMSQVRMRAIETGLPILRATAHAHTGVVDPLGDAHTLPADLSGGLVLTIPQPEPTLFRKSGQLAYLPVYVLTALLLGAALIQRTSALAGQSISCSKSVKSLS